MKKAWYLIIILIGFITFYELVSSQWTSYHNFEGRCLDCHLTDPESGRGPGTLRRDITFMCIGCHKGVQELSHPVDIKASMAVPSAFPLDWRGAITCITCHPAHQQGYGPYHMRVRAAGEGLCLSCHSDMEKQLHKTAVGTAHIGNLTSNRYMPGVEAGINLDQLSLKCLACHDALIAGEALVESRDVTLEESTDGTPGFHDNYEIGLSHPIGVSYAEAKRKYQGAYRRIEDLPPQIQFFEGMVGCGTCHNPYSKRHNELVMGNEGSALCLACHVK